MKKLLLSAFAMSLCLLSERAWSLNKPIEEFRELQLDDVLGLESDDPTYSQKEILPELHGFQRFSPRDLHQKSEWNVEEKQVEIDSQPLKGQKHSLIPWETQDPEQWLSIDKWMAERNLKDKTPLWKLRLRDFSQNEHVGKVLQCRGKCEIYRGSSKASVQHLSSVLEGDEFKTDTDSVAWVYLIDGTLVRIGPESSVGFLESNWSKETIFHLLRLNQGHVYWHPRESKDYPMELGPETDSFSLPILIREANQASFEREIFKTQSDREKLEETLKLEETAINAQLNRLNEFKKANNVLQLPASKVVVAAPNGTLIGKNTSFDFFYYPGGKAYFKKRTSPENHEFSVQMRGYSNTDLSTIGEEAWFEIDRNGRNYEKMDKVSGNLEITELITRRIKTIELAREIWFEKYTLPVVKRLDDPQQLATHFGYKLWDGDINKRYDYWIEFMRRMETSNLKSVDNLLNKIESEGRMVQKEISDSHYKAALNFYLRSLKLRYTNKWMQVREMNNLQYYVWILQHGKK